MIKNHIIDKICCLDQNMDIFELIESICFNTVVLDLRAVKASIIINQKMAHKLSESLRKWAEGGNNGKS